MPTSIIMPKFEMSQETGTIARWLKHNGDSIGKGDAILEVETDKVTMEVESPASGTLSGIAAQAGDVIPIGQVIAFVLKAGEIAVDAPSANPPPAREAATEARATPVAEKMAMQNRVSLANIRGTGKAGQITKSDVEAHLAPGIQRDTAQDVTGAIRAVPAARRLARELEIDLSTVSGSGPQQRIQSNDVERAAIQRQETGLQRNPSPEHSELPAPSFKTHPAQGAPISQPLSSLRRTIAQRMTQSTREVPQFNLSVDVNMARLLAVVEDWKASAQPDQPKVTLTALLIKVCAWALLRNPAVNAAFMGDHIDRFANAHIGVAVAVDDGLLVPVIHNAESLSVPQIAAALSALSAKARAGKLGLTDIQGGTFSISNLGMFAVDRFTAIVNPPQAAILAVGRATKRFVVGPDDQPLVAPVSTLTVSADHRAVDGAIVGRFLGDLQNGCERPGLLL